jgi:hypothetical protein
LAQFQDGHHQNPRRVRFVKDPVWESPHDLSSDFLKVNGRDLGEHRNARQVGINRGNKLDAEALPMVFEAIEGSL